MPNMPVVVGTPACVPEGTISDVTVRIRGPETVPPVLAAGGSRGRRRRGNDPRAAWIQDKLEITDGFGHAYAYAGELGGGNFAKAYLFESATTDDRLAVRVEWQGAEIVLPPEMGAADGLLLARTKSFFNARLQVMELGTMTAEKFFTDRRNAEFLPEFECFVRALALGLLDNGLTYYDLKPDNIVVCKCPTEGFLYFRAIDIDSVGTFANPNRWAMYHVDRRPADRIPEAHSVISTAFAALLTVYMAKLMSRTGRFDVVEFYQKAKWKKREVPWDDDYTAAAAHWRSFREFAPFFRAIKGVRPRTTTAATALKRVRPTLLGGCEDYDDGIAMEALRLF